MLPALTVSLSRSTSSPHSSGCAAKYPLTISWVGCAQTTADSAPSRRSTADSLVDRRWKDRASRTDERRPNRCGSVRDTVGYDDRIRERASRYSVAEDLSGGVAVDGGSVRRHLAGRSPSPLVERADFRPNDYDDKLGSPETIESVGRLATSFPSRQKLRKKKLTPARPAACPRS